MAVRVEGSSMEPTICRGQTVLAKNTEKPPRKGDVVLIKTQDERLVVHRVASTFHIGARFYLVHKGDNSSEWGLASSQDIVGIVPDVSKKMTGIGPLGFLRFSTLLPANLPFWIRRSAINSLRFIFRRFYHAQKN